MKPATQLTEIVRNLYGWSSLHPQWKIELNSYALRTAAGVWLVDPLQPAEPVVQQLAELGEPVGIFLTNPNHDRDAAWFRRRFKLQIYAHEKAQSDCDTKIDVLVLDGELLPGGLKVLHLPGASTGEAALYTKMAKGIVLLGDVLIHPSETGLALLPDTYLEDRSQAIKSLRRLLDLNFQVATFAHGAPLATDARAAITKFLNLLGKKKRKS